MGDHQWRGLGPLGHRAPLGPGGPAASIAVCMAGGRARLRRVRAAYSPRRGHAGRAGHPHLMPDQAEPAEPAEHRIEVHLDELLAARGMTLVELSARVGVTVANLSILKNG